MQWVICLVTAYLLGSIPSAYYAGKWGKGIDLRAYGSGNLGFTNALRALGPKLSAPVLLFDVCKGLTAVFLARWLLPGTELAPVLCGLVAILGHNWTIFLGFQGGGKGVATSSGVFLALMPVPFLLSLAVFLIVLAATRYVSLGSIAGAVALPLAGFVLYWTRLSISPSVEVLTFAVIASLLVVIRHKTNIQRLLDGTEAKIGQKAREGHT